jgi:hypothetical protein
MKQLTIGLGVLLSVCAAATRAEAQEIASTLEQLAVLVKPGDSVRLIDATGRETNGRIARVLRDVLIVETPAGPRQLGESEVVTITQRRGDSLKNGATIGGVAGAAYFATMMAIFSQYNDGGDVIVVTAVTTGALMVGLGAAVGVAIDALIARQQVIFQKAASPRRVTVSPLVGQGRRGAAVTISF